jgi:hypothetical protein
VDTEPSERNSSQEWEIGEPLRRSIGDIPLPPRAPARDALSALKAKGADELRTLELLERSRGLTDNEHRQARSLRRLLAALDEAYSDNRSR